MTTPLPTDLQAWPPDARALLLAEAHRMTGDTHEWPAPHLTGLERARVIAETRAKWVTTTNPTPGGSGHPPTTESDP